MKSHVKLIPGIARPEVRALIIVTFALAGMGIPMVALFLLVGHAGSYCSQLLSRCGTAALGLKEIAVYGAAYALIPLLVSIGYTYWQTLQWVRGRTRVPARLLLSLEVAAVAFQFLIARGIPNLVTDADVSTGYFPLFYFLEIAPVVIVASLLVRALWRRVIEMALP